MADVKLKFTLAPRSDATSVAVRSLQTSEFNPVRIMPVVLYYAFLEKVEENYRKAFAGPPWEANLGLLPNAVDSPERNGLDAREQRREPEVGFGQFDCIRADHFDGQVNHYKLFYNIFRGGQDIEATYDWQMNNQLLPYQSEHHAICNREFHKDGAILGFPNFLSLNLVFENTGENWARFQTQFPDQGWYALGLMRSDATEWLLGLAANVWVGDIGDTEGSEDRYWSVADIYELEPVQLNRIRHIVSLDFASDAYFPPEKGPQAPSVKPELSPFLQQQIAEAITAKKRRAKKTFTHGPRKRPHSGGGIQKPPPMRTGGIIVHSSRNLLAQLLKTEVV